MALFTMGATIKMTPKNTEVLPCESCEDPAVIKRTIHSNEDAYMNDNSAKYRTDLKKWGTRSGVMHVSFPETKKRNCDPSRDAVFYATDEGVMEISDCDSGRSPLSHFGSAQHKRQRNLVKDQKQKEGFKQYQKYLHDEFDVMQVTVKNHTTDIRNVCLWGGNSEKPITDPLFIENSEKIDVLVGTHPQQVVLNPANDLLYVANQLSDSVSVVARDGTVIATIPLTENAMPGTVSPIALAVNTNSGYFFGMVYVIGSVNNTMYHIGLNHKMVDANRTGKRPTEILFDNETNELVIKNIVSKSTTRINAETQAQTETPWGIQDQFRLVDNESTSDLAKVTTQLNLLTIFNASKSPTVTINDEYHEEREDFKFSPGMLKHLKIVASGERRVNALQLLQKSIAGKEICKTLSLGNYQSPQSFQNVSEVFGVDGVMLDGQNSWCFKIGGLQTITFILYYKKLEMYNLLPEKASLAYGVQMSKGVPKRVPNNPFKSIL